MTVMDPPSELDKLWQLLSELSAQLSHNRQQTEELHKRAEELKTQAIHTQTGFTLRRFNTDISDEEFDSELEKLNVSLVMENQSLAQENRQLSILLKDYEQTLETVMAKFRAHAHATQQHHLDLIKHYEGILLSLPPSITLGSLPAPPQPPSDPLAQAAAASSSTSASPPIPTASTFASTSSSSSSSSSAFPTIQPTISVTQEGIDPLHLQLSLSHLSSLIRKALRSLGGEDPSSFEGSSADSPPLNPFEPTIEGPPSPTSSNFSLSSSYPTTTSTDSTKALSLDLLRERDASTGGYLGHTASTAPHYIPTTSTSNLVASPGKPPRNVREEDLERGGKDGSWKDLPLEREIEIEALRRENAELRKALGIMDTDD